MSKEIKIALFNLDSLITNKAIVNFLETEKNRIAFVGLSNPYRQKYGGIVGQTRRLIKYSLKLAIFMGFNIAFTQFISFLSHIFTFLPGSIEQECKKRNIPTYKIENINDDKIVSLLKEHKVDLFLSCYFDQIFNEKVISSTPLGGINVHSSLLPKNKGPMPVMYSLLEEQPSCGVSVHFISSGIDEGDLISQSSHYPKSHESVMKISQDLHETGLNMVREILKKDFKNMDRMPQGQGDYQGFPGKQEFQELSSRKIEMISFEDIKKYVI